MKLKKLIIICTVSFFTFLNANCQIRHFYHRLDVGSGNIYTFVGSNLITAFANYLSHTVLFDNSFNYSFYSGKYQINNISIKHNNIAGITARDLFDDIHGGVKLGYKSDSFNAFNWGIYGSAHYKLNQFKSRLTDVYEPERLSYFKPGVGLFFLFGGIEHKTWVQIETGAQYCIPIVYSGRFGNTKVPLNKGIATTYSIKIGGSTDFTGGVFLNLYHFNIFKENYYTNFKMYNVGVTLTITPKRGEKYYD